MAAFAHYLSWLRLVTVALVAIALLGAGDLAGAQEATGVATEAATGAPAETVVVTDTASSVATPGTVPKDGDGGQTDADATAMSGTAKGWLVAGLLALAVVTVAMHYYFLGKSRQEYFRAATALFRQGVFPQPIMAPAQGDVPGGVLTTARMTESDGTTATLEVVGPPALTRGQQGIYVALLNGVRTEQAIWTVDPPEAATTTPGTGAITVVGSTVEGQFSLTASVPDLSLTTPPQTITVLPDAKPVSEKASPGLPFIGQGFASLVGAVVLIAAVVVLAAIGVDDWEVIGTIFGALAGYLFGMATNTKE